RQLVPALEGASHEVVPHRIRVGAPNHPRAAVRGAAGVVGAEPVQIDDLHAATGEAGSRGAAVDSESEDDDLGIECRHAVPASPALIAAMLEMSASTSF